MTKYVCSACSATFTVASAAKPPRCRKCGSRDTAPFSARAEQASASDDDVAELPDDLEEIGSADALTEEVETAPTRAGRPSARRSTRRGHAAPEKAKTPPVAAFVGIGATLIAVAAVFIATRGGSKDEETNGSKPAETAAQPAPEKPPANPAEDLAARRARLAPGDLAGRKELIALAKEHELNDARLALLREVLLLDSEDVDARRALGFTKHETAGSLFQGRWLTKSDAELAAAYDSRIGKGAP